MQEENKFERAGSISYGCATGAHLWDEDMGHSTVERDGNLTKLKIRCLRCGVQFDISAPLELNDMIGKTTAAPQQRPSQPVVSTPQPQYQPQPVTRPAGNDDRPDIIRRLLGEI